MKVLVTLCFVLFTSISLSAELKIGVIDVGKLLDGYDKYQDAQKKLVQSSNAWKNTLKKLQLVLDKLEIEIRELRAESKERAKLITEYDKKLSEYRLEQYKSKLELTQVDSRLSLNVYRDIIQGIKDFALLNKYHLVFKKEDLRQRGKSAKRLSDELKMASVLFSDPELDITQKILKMLNERYRRSQKIKLKKETSKKENSKTEGK